MYQVSIAIPLYNTEEYIEKCIQSCLNQTFQNLEIIIINDGSTDASESIARAYAKKYKHIKLITTPNGGLSAARNKGLEYATGKYIYFLDSDDWIDVDCIEKCYMEAEKNQLDLLMFDAKTIVAEEVKSCYQFNSYITSHIIKTNVVWTGYEFAKQYYDKIGIKQAWLLFLRRDFLLENQILFLDKAYYEDVKFFYDCVLCAKRVEYIENCFYNRLYRENSIVTSDINITKIQSAFHIVLGMLGSWEKINENQLFWLRVLQRYATNVFIFVTKQIDYRNISVLGQYWTEMEEQIYTIIQMLYSRFIQGNVGQESIVELLTPLKSIVKPFECTSDRILILAEEIYQYEQGCFRKRLKTLSVLSDKDASVGIYGSGKHADTILKMYQKQVGEIKCHLVFLDSFKESFQEKHLGYDVINIKDIATNKIDEILILSFLHEESMYEMAKQYASDMKITVLYGNDYYEDLSRIYIQEESSYGALQAIRNYNAQKKRIILLNIPKHTNSGDYLITLAEERFFANYFPEYELVEFSGAEFASNPGEIFNQIYITDLVVITGGGFFGSLWPSGKNVIPMLQGLFRNKIIIFPQSVYFEDSKEADKQLEETKKAFYNCSDITLCVREKVSFERAMEVFGDEIPVVLLPDIALTLGDYSGIQEREGVLLCLRKDKESVLSERAREEIKEWCKTHFDKVTETSMHWHEIIDNKTKEYVLQQKLDEFRTSQLVITDTLHCMISCAITGTPCIAIDNLTNKVKGVYEWIKELEYVKCLENYQELWDVDIRKWSITKHKYFYTQDLKTYEKKLVSLLKESV